MSTPLANKTTFSSRMKTAAFTSSKPSGTNLYNNNISKSTNANVIGGPVSRLPPKTTIKSSQPPGSINQVEKKQHLAGTSSRIAPPRSILERSAKNCPDLPKDLPERFVAPAVVGAQRTVASSFANSRSSSRVSSTSNTSAAPRVSNISHVSSNLPRQDSSISTSRQNSLASSNSAHVATVRKPLISSSRSTYVPDTNSIRKGLAKFSNPIECQRQFQALNSEIRQLNEIILNKDRKNTRLLEQLDEVLKKGVGYATIVQYFAKKLKIDSEDLDLESECRQLREKVEQLLKNESEYETRLEATVEDYKQQVFDERHLKVTVQKELEETREAHSKELISIEEAHKTQLNDLVKQHSSLKHELETRIAYLETELNTKTKELNELRTEYETLNDNYNKLEESLTKDKDARVKYAQEKANQLQKEVESLNSVLEMRTEKMHALQKDSILLGEAQQEVMTLKDSNKALKQQLESMNAALEIKRIKYENLLADSEKIAQELKKERKERRRMTMRTEQLEYALNESFTNDNNLTIAEAGGVES